MARSNSKGSVYLELNAQPGCMLPLSKSLHAWHSPRKARRAEHPLKQDPATTADIRRLKSLDTSKVQEYIYVPICFWAAAHRSAPARSKTLPKSPGRHLCPAATCHTNMATSGHVFGPVHAEPWDMRQIRHVGMLSAKKKPSHLWNIWSLITKHPQLYLSMFSLWF